MIRYIIFTLSYLMFAEFVFVFFLYHVKQIYFVDDGWHFVEIIFLNYATTNKC